MESAATTAAAAINEEAPSARNASEIETKNDENEKNLLFKSEEISKKNDKENLNKIEAAAAIAGKVDGDTSKAANIEKPIENAEEKRNQKQKIKNESSEKPEQQSSSTADVAAADTTASNKNVDKFINEQQLTKISSSPELAKITTTTTTQTPQTPNAPIIPLNILSPPKSESQTDETNTASTSPASEATMSPKLLNSQDEATIAAITTTTEANSKQSPTAAITAGATNKPGNSNAKAAKAPTKATTVANGTVPKTGGKPLLATINKKMNKPTRKRKPKALVALYESEISHNTAGIKLCIKKSDLSSTPLTAASIKTTTTTGAGAAKNRKRTRKPKAKPYEEDSEFEIKRKKSTNSNNNGEQAGSKSKKANEAANDLAAKAIVDQSIWAANMPEEVLYQIFQEVVDKDPLPMLFRLTRVCSLWRRVALRPSLWKSMDLSTWVKEKYRTELKLKWFIQNRCSGCTDLNISNWKVTNIDCVLQIMADSSPNLESINLTGWKGFTCDHLAFLVGNLKKLGRLDLSSINSDMNPTKSAVSLLSLRNALEVMNERLTHLYLAHNRLPGIPQIVEALATNCPNLLLLDLSNVVTFAASHAVLHVEKLQHGCPKLKVLRVTNSRMSLNTSSMQEMMDSPGFPNLEELSVAAQSGEESRLIGDEHLQRILKTSSKLKLLDVRGCMRLSHESLIRLPAWDIKHLFLSGCSVTRDFSSRLELIASKWAHSLIELDLAWTNVQQPLDNALRVIAEKGLDSPLAHLNLCGSSVSEEAVKDILANCAYMSSINLASCRGLPRGVKRLIQGPEELRELRDVLKVQMKVKLPSASAAVEAASKAAETTAGIVTDAGGGGGSSVAGD